MERHVAWLLQVKGYKELYVLGKRQDLGKRTMTSFIQ